MGIKKINNTGGISPDTQVRANNAKAATGKIAPKRKQDTAEFSKEALALAALHQSSNKDDKLTNSTENQAITSNIIQSDSINHSNSGYNTSSPPATQRSNTLVANQESPNTSHALKGRNNELELDILDKIARHYPGKDLYFKLDREHDVLEVNIKDPPIPSWVKRILDKLSSKLGV